MPTMIRTPNFKTLRHAFRYYSLYGDSTDVLRKAQELEIIIGPPLDNEGKVIENITIDKDGRYWIV